MREILVTVSAGLFGVLGPGSLTRLFGWLLRSRPGEPFTGGAGLIVLIPAHDEALNITDTIRSVRAAATAAGSVVRIAVGADSCADSTAELALAAGAEVHVVAFRSKWKTLVALLREAREEDWVALVDAGAKWPESLLRDLRPVFDDAYALGVAPAYFPARSSFIERALWRSEAFWKRGENSAGGPVSVHGATVFYRARAIRTALAFLERFGKDSWLNDDVVIPFAARLTHPGCTLPYWCPSDTSRRVSDIGLREDSPQAARRSRMVAGNLEWILTLFPWSVLRSPRIACVAARRVFRVFWAYSALLVLGGAFLSVLPPGAALAAAAAVSLAGGVVLAVGGKRGIVDAALASLLAPALAVAVLRGRKNAWG